MRCACLMGGVCGVGVIGCYWGLCAGDGQDGIRVGDLTLLWAKLLAN